MRLNNLNYLYLLLFIFISSSCGIYQIKPFSYQNSLKIKCIDENVIVSKDSISLHVKFINIGVDTILLPYHRLDKSPFFELFVFETVFCCGIHSNYNVPLKSNKSTPCSKKDIDEKRYRFLYPSDTLDYIYNLNSLGYFPKDDLIEGNEYTYIIKLNIPNEFKNICSNIWTGSVESNIGKFKVKQSH